MPWSSSRRRAERGAAAVEFALVSPVVFAIMFGTLSYGLWFNDSLNLRQGLREASRQGVVANYGTTTSCGATYATAPTENIKKLVCKAKDEVSANTGKTYVKVVLPDGWSRGKELIVCGMVKADAIPGLVPLPQDRMIRFASRMSIEMFTPGQTETGGAEALPAGASWGTWCA